MRPRLRMSLALLGMLAVSAPAASQSSRARLLVTVADTTGAVIPDAKVSVTGLEDSNRLTAIPAIQTSGDGIATLSNLAPGRYSVGAEFSGFEPGLLADVRVRPGDNKQTIVLKIQSVQETVNVGQEGQEAASNRGNVSFGVKLSDEQLDALSDDPDELAKQLKDMAGPNAIIRVDSFEGMQLPPKAQIKSVHVTRDQFAAESPNPGDTFVEIITQPGVGPIRGSFNANVRAGAISARSPFASARGPDQNQRYGLNVGGTLKQNKASFSVNVNGSTQYTAPNLYASTPGGATRAETLKLRTPSNSFRLSSLVDYSLTRDQTLRFGYYDEEFTNKNQGVGAYDLPERAYTNRANNRYGRLQHAGPLGRRTFINTRLFAGRLFREDRSADEAPTIIVQDAFNSGGAQRRGGSRTWGFVLNSDLDYIRGIHSWRTGMQMLGFANKSNSERNYLGTFTFPDTDAYLAGKPSLYTRAVGDPLVKYFDAEIGIYVQDDLRISKGLTVSPGLRYSTQNLARYPKAFEPRFGLTWAPTPGGKTTLRASAGIFHNFMDFSNYEQTLRIDGVRQRELQILNPSYPDPGSEGSLSTTNKYVIGDYPLPQNSRYSAGIDQNFSPQLKLNVLYNYIHQGRQPRGENLNPLINGVRPDPNFANVIQAVTDGKILRHELYVTVNANLAPGQAASRPLLNWRRVSAVGTYQWIRARRNVGFAFDVPPSGSLDIEWGNGPGDLPYWYSVNVNSTQLRNLNIGVTVQGNDGYPYTERTGLDDNGDGIINDRPAGVGLWSLRGTPQVTVSSRIAYTLTPGSAPGTPQGQVRYRYVLFVNVNNLTNHANYSGFSGVIRSQFFQKPTSVNNPRRVDFGMNVNF
jgi:hypothetical protein